MRGQKKDKWQTAELCVKNMSDYSFRSFRVELSPSSDDNEFVPLLKIYNFSSNL